MLNKLFLIIPNNIMLHLYIVLIVYCTNILDGTVADVVGVRCHSWYPGLLDRLSSSSLLFPSSFSRHLKHVSPAGAAAAL